MLLGQIWVRGEKAGIEFNFNDFENLFCCNELMGAEQADPPEKGNSNHAFYMAEGITPAIVFFSNEYKNTKLTVNKLTDLQNSAEYFRLGREQQEDVDQRVFDEINTLNEHEMTVQEFLKIQGYLEIAAKMYGEDCYTPAPVLLEIWNG